MWFIAILLCGQYVNCSPGGLKVLLRSACATLGHRAHGGKSLLKFTLLTSGYNVVDVGFRAKVSDPLPGAQ